MVPGAQEVVLKEVLLGMGARVEDRVEGRAEEALAAVDPLRAGDRVMVRSYQHVPYLACSKHL